MPSEEVTASKANDLPAAVRHSRDSARSDLVQVLQTSVDLAKSVKEWQAGDLYRAVGKPGVVVNLEKAVDGSYRGFARSTDGKFIGQARWLKTSSVATRLASTVATLAGHAMLVEISHKLDRIENKIDRIERGQRDDRRAELRSRIEQVNDNHSVSDIAKRHALLRDLVGPLRDAVKKEILTLKRDLHALPSPPDRHYKGFFWDTSEDVRAALGTCQESLAAIVEGVQAIGHVYVGIEEPRLYGSVTVALLDELIGLPLGEAKDKARRIRPNESEPWPEAFWVEAETWLRDARDRARSYVEALDAGAEPTFSIELTEGDIQALAASAEAPTASLNQVDDVKRGES